MTFKKRAHTLKYLLLLALIIVIFFGFDRIPFISASLHNPQVFQRIILDFGFWAPAGVVLINLFQAIFSVIPSELLTVVAGFIFGPILGLVYSLVGAFLGSMIVFIAARHYGKNLASRFFEKKEIVHFNGIFREKRLWGLFLVRVAPIFPDDMVSFTAGLTTMRLWSFNLISTLGFAVTMIIYSFFGSELSSGVLGGRMIILTIIVVGICLIGLFKSKIKRMLVKDWYQLEQEVEKEFRKI